MKLYYFADGCSLATHIALREAGLAFEAVRVDPQTRMTDEKKPFPEVNPKGYVPALVFDDGSMLTENVALLDWVAQRSPALKPADDNARTRLIEMLAFISTEVHKPFLAMFFLPGEEAKPTLSDAIAARFVFLAERLQGDHLLGGSFSTADAFLYVMLRWARASEIETPSAFDAYVDRIEGRPAVQAALRAEGLA